MFNIGRDYTYNVSTHTPLGGVTYFIEKKYLYYPVSTHTPLGGVTFVPVEYQDYQSVSTHTPLGGVTGSSLNYGFDNSRFNSHASGRRDVHF